MSIGIRASSLGEVVRPKVLISGREYELYELSEDGFSAFVSRQDTFSVDSAPLSWELRADGIALWEGTAEIVSSVPSRNGARLALKVTSAPLDLNAIVLRSRHADLRAQLRTGGANSDRLVSPEYKAFCADVTSTLKAYRRLADRIDRDLASSARTIGDSLLEEASARLISDWLQFSKLGSGLSQPHLANPVTHSALRAFTQRLVTSEITPGAIWRRAFEKPRGYPGDYGVMNYLYEASDVGETTYARLCHRLGLHFAECVRTRKDMVRDAVLGRMGQGTPVAATSIACGSAQEIFELATTENLPGALTATLLDQDPEALEFAMKRLQVPLSRRGVTFKVEARQARFGDFSDRNGAVPANQDLIYCFGMFDYLPDDTIQAITATLYDKLSTGGTLILGNLKSPSEKAWGLTVVLGYDVWFRTEEQMLSLARELPGARTELRLESTGYNYLLFVHKS